MEKPHLFFVDAETDGLYGSFLSVAALVTDGEGRELEEFYGEVAVSPAQLRSSWAREHVLPGMGKTDRVYSDEEALQEAFWAFWLRHRERAECVAYVQYPVEARLFTACVMRQPEKREFLGPFPLYDLSTLLSMSGLHFDADLQQLSGMQLPSHHALNDVRLSAATWRRLWSKLPVTGQEKTY